VFQLIVDIYEVQSSKERATPEKTEYTIFVASKILVFLVAYQNILKV